MVNLVLLKVIEPIDDDKWGLTVSDKEGIHPGLPGSRTWISYIASIPTQIISVFMMGKRQNNNKKHPRPNT